MKIKILIIIYYNFNLPKTLLFSNGSHSINVNYSQTFVNLNKICIIIFQHEPNQP